MSLLAPLGIARGTSVVSSFTIHGCDSTRDVPSRTDVFVVKSLQITIPATVWSGMIIHEKALSS